MKALLLLSLALTLIPATAETGSPAENKTENEVHYVQTPAGRLELHQDRGPCQAQAKRAAFLPAIGDPVGGCWVTDGSVVAIVFLDGDIAQVPVAALKTALGV